MSSALILSRRTLLLVGPVVLLTACATRNASDETGDAASPSVPVGTFPVTIEHALGSTTIESAPKRIVTIGDVDLDALLALGAVPLATMMPANAGVEDLPEYLRERLDGADLAGLTFDSTPEEIAAFEPHVIFSVSWFGRAEDYDVLSKIAPVVIGPKLNTYTSRSQTTEIIAQSLGRADEGKTLATGAEAAFAGARENYPQFAEKTAIFIIQDREGHWLNGPNDTRQLNLQELGLRFPEALERLVEGKAFVQLSLEQSNLLEADVVVVTDVFEGLEALTSDRLFQTTKAFREDRIVVVDEELYFAIRNYSVLSAPYVVDHLPPLLEAALAKA